MFAKILAGFASGGVMVLVLGGSAIAATATIDKPMFNGKRLAWCLNWSADCGKSAADAFCRTNGYLRATSFARAPDIGGKSPTRHLATGAVCDAGFCDGFMQITCLKQPAVAGAGAPAVAPGAGTAAADEMTRTEKLAAFARRAYFGPFGTPSAHDAAGSTAGGHAAEAAKPPVRVVALPEPRPPATASAVPPPAKLATAAPDPAPTASIEPKPAPAASSKSPAAATSGAPTSAPMPLTGETKPAAKVAARPPKPPSTAPSSTDTAPVASNDLKPPPAPPAAANLKPAAKVAAPAPKPSVTVAANDPKPAATLAPPLDPKPAPKVAVSAPKPTTVAAASGDGSEPIPGAGTPVPVKPVASDAPKPKAEAMEPAPTAGEPKPATKIAASVPKPTPAPPSSVSGGGPPPSSVSGGGPVPGAALVPPTKPVAVGAASDTKPASAAGAGTSAASGEVKVASTALVPLPTARPAPARSQVFAEPVFNGKRLDWCRGSKDGCGKVVADDWCKAQGFIQAVDFTPDPHIGATKPTRQLASGLVCDEARCDGFKVITCSD